MIKAGIIGASGYGGGELVRLLSGHPDVELTYLSSETYKGKDIGAALPNMKGYLNIECEGYNPELAIERCDLLFMAQHNGWAMNEAAKYLDAGLKIIDLSADFRLRTPKSYEHWYKLTHASPKLIEQAVYGLPELYARDIVDAQLIANPGCFVTSAILGLAPMLKEKLIDPTSIIIDSLSGVSGAGRSSFKLDYHFSEVNQGMKAYGVGGVHRHVPEIEQELSGIASCPITVSFTPHLIPVTRGILSTMYTNIIGGGWETGELVNFYKEYYKSAPFVVVLDEGELPCTKNVLGSNYCHIGMKIDPRTNRVIVISAIDNLIKGMAGQAVQNMNLMYGLDEKSGIDKPGGFPW